MRALLFKAVLVLTLIGGYIGAPFFTAWSIREAVRNGDSIYLASAIDWPAVRESLKPDLTRLALDLPDTEFAPSAKPGLWQRMKAYWGKGTVERAIDGYITPDGLPQLFAARKAYRNYVSRDSDASESLPLIERVKRAWTRVKRAEFTTLTSFEIDMADKTDEKRIFLGRMTLGSTGWRLTHLRVKDRDGYEDQTSKLMSLGPQTQQAALPRTASNRWSFVTPAEAAPARVLATPTAQVPRQTLWQRLKQAAHGMRAKDR